MYQRARGGVLFIDELYGIISESSALNTVLERCKTGFSVTIGAGYVEELQKTFFSNPGNELYQIFLVMAQGAGIRKHIDDNAMSTLMYLFACFSAPRVNGTFPATLVEKLHCSKGHADFIWAF